MTTSHSQRCHSLEIPSKYTEIDGKAAKNADYSALPCPLPRCLFPIRTCSRHAFSPLSSFGMGREPHKKVFP
uniref:Uncharacterized protein n=1 Tax=Solanum tuberosum TaxID=4113 RepID=M1A7G3_SOLTU